MHQACIQLLDYSAFYLTFLRTSSMHSGHKPHAMAAEVWMRISMQEQSLLLVCGFGKQTAIINRIGNETTDVLVHPPGGAQEDALLWCYGSVVLKQIFQRRCTRLPWMHPWDGLSKLHLVPDQDNVARTGTQGDEVRERHLTSLVDEQVV